MRTSNDQGAYAGMQTTAMNSQVSIAFDFSSQTSLTTGWYAGEEVARLSSRTGRVGAGGNGEKEGGVLAERRVWEGRVGPSRDWVRASPVLLRSEGD